MIPYQPFLNLPPQTVVPNPVDDTQNFIEFMNRFYEEIGFIVNARQIPYYTINISDVAEDIPNLPQFGAYLVCVSGIASTQPTGVWSLCKSDSTAVGFGAEITNQAGTGIWAGINLVIAATTNTFQIYHGLTGTTGVFNISVFGTQVGTE